MRFKPRTIVSVASAFIVAVILFLLRHEVVEAFHLLSQVNLWVLALIVPAQVFAYYAVGAMIFSYLKQKGELGDTPSWELAKMALELNFVNHILPSAGVSGASYMAWRLKQLGVSAARATLAQVVRFVATFATYLLLLIISVIFITADGSITRFTILACSILVSLIVFGTVVLIYVFNSEYRMQMFSKFVGSTLNRFWRNILGRKKDLLDQIKINHFFSEFHEDYLKIKSEPWVLKKPLLWGLASNLAEVSLFFIVFLALGDVVNPAQIFVAYGIATLAGAFLVTPGGVGGYEALMIFILVASGMHESLAFAGVLLTRVILLVCTMASGYVFYQLALTKYGKRTA